MNWGNKLVLVFIVFAALIFTLVYKAVNTKFDLVSKDYYKDELRYQEKIDGIHKANTLSSVAITQNNSTVTLALPKEMNGEKVAGEAWFYCKSDADRDKKFVLKLDDSSKQAISKKELPTGAYQLKLTWQSVSGNYYTEQDVIIQ